MTALTDRARDGDPNGRIETMSNWTNDDDLTEPSETDDRPLMGTTGGSRARTGDAYVLAFMDDGEKVDTANGERVAFDARLLEASFAPVDGDGNEIDEGDDVRFMTGSARLLSELKAHAPVGGDAYRVAINGTGYDAAYSVEQVDDE